MNLITLDKIDSTNAYVRTELADAPSGTVVSAHTQTAGRGQRGNSWEAEPGCNLTFSVLLRPTDIAASNQQAINEAVSTAIVDTLDPLVPDAEKLCVKWPNDIYYGDSKLGGILIENALRGNTIDRSIVGVGLNINQMHFVSDAPNPISLRQLTGNTMPLLPLLEQIANAIISNVEHVATVDGREAIGLRYRSKLWRRNGLHPYVTPDGKRFMASIDGIAPTGHISLLHDDDSITTHAFKEVAAIIDNTAL